MSNLGVGTVDITNIEALNDAIQALSQEQGNAVIKFIMPDGTSFYCQKIDPDMLDEVDGPALSEGSVSTAFTTFNDYYDSILDKKDYDKLKGWKIVETRTPHATYQIKL